MAKNKKIRAIGIEKIYTVGELVKQLKSNFKPNDDIVTMTIAIIAEDADIDADTERAPFSLHTISNSVSSIIKNREERNNAKKEEQPCKLR